MWSLLVLAQRFPRYWQTKHARLVNVGGFALVIIEIRWRMDDSSGTVSVPSSNAQLPSRLSGSAATTSIDVYIYSYENVYTSTNVYIKSDNRPSFATTVCRFWFGA